VELSQKYRVLFDTCLVDVEGGVNNVGGLRLCCSNVLDL
jgi:hypothetical protein